MTYRLAIPNIQIDRRRLLIGAGTLSALGLTARFPLNASAVQPNPTYAPFLARDTVHSISIAFDQTAYDEMIATFAESQSKEWIAATVTIDGSTYENAGIRLKGNSSLGGGRAEVNLSEDGPVPAGTPIVTGGEDGGPITTRSGPGGNLEDRDPESLPWLIRLDKNVEDQNHEGTTQLVIRSNNSQTSLNEAVALALLDKAGLASQQAAHTAFSVNGSDEVLRLAIEHPKDAWMEARFSPDGLLYKAESTGDYSYRGTDPADYVDVFELEAGGTGDEATDLTPLLELLDFLNNSTDANFETDIATHVDLDLFATYLAMMDLIENFDDIDGPGNNSYLYVGPDSQQFTVVPWDMNLAFGNMGPGPTNFPDFPAGGPDAPPTIDGTPVSEMMPDASLIIVNGVNAEGTPIASGERPGNGQMRTGPGMSNKLVERTATLPDFPTQIESQTTQLRADLYASGIAAGILDEWATRLTTQAGHLVEASVVENEASAIAAFFME